MKFETLVKKLFINPMVLSEIESWKDDPELSKLLKALRSANKQQLFLDHFAEAMVARHLISRGCKLEVEVPTTNGRHADFKVSKNNCTFFAHIKRLNLEHTIQQEIKVITRLRNFRNIPKPFNVTVSLSDRLTDEEMQELYKQLEHFIKNAQVGDKKNIIYKDKILARCEIFSKLNGKGKNVSVYVLPKLWAPNDRKRFYEKLRDAYKQFMPGSLNIILVASYLKDALDDFESSLLASSGFWSNNNHPDSCIAACFKFGLKDDYINFKTWCRGDYKVSEFITNLFEDSL